MGLGNKKPSCAKSTRYWIRIWREEGDLNPRVLSDIGLAIQRLTELGHLRLVPSSILQCSKPFDYEAGMDNNVLD